MANTRILLVDDEPQLLRLIQSYLKRLDYEVDAYDTAGEALRGFEADAQRYDAVIADIGMPDISGEALLRKMLLINPKLRVLVCSGSLYEVSELSAPPHHVAFLLKPFTPAMLARALDELISKQG